MNLFERLAEATRRQNAEGELPDFLVPLLLKVAGDPAALGGREELVAELLLAVEEYQTYSNVCCEKIGFGLEDIHRTLDKLRTGSAADPLAVGVAFSAQHVVRVPRDDYDQPLDWIVTEKAAHHFASVPAEVIAAMHQVW